jgi:hypothetical protein
VETDERGLAQTTAAASARPPLDAGLGDALEPPQHSGLAGSGAGLNSDRTDVAEFFRLIDQDADIATAFLRAHPTIADAIATAFSLPEEEGTSAIDFQAAEVLSVGHRTAVIRAHARGRGMVVPPRPVVLKLIKPSRSSDNAAFEELEAERRLSATRVLAHGPRYLISEVAPGVPLLQWLAHRGWLEKAGHRGRAGEFDARIDAAAQIGEAICSSLIEMEHVAGGSHGNLSLTSVLVDEAPERLYVHLVDAGAEFRDAERREPTDAPGLASGREMGGPLSDAYALGVILLQVLTSEPLVYNSLQRPLAEAWTICPELARVIEDLVDEHQEQRLTMLNPSGTAGRWSTLQKWITAERRLARLFRPSSDILDGGTSEASISSWNQVRRYFAAAADVRLSGEAGWPGYDLLKYINLASYGLWVLCLTGFVVLTSADIGLSTPGGDALRFINAVGRYHVGDVSGNLPGRVLALSFSYAALTFYSRILASVTARKLGVPLIEASLRTVPFVFQLPAAWVIFYDPTAWPIAATIGVLATAVVNGFMRNLDRRALHAMRDPLDYDEDDVEGARRQREPYRSWSRTAAMYLTLIVAFDFLLYRYHKLHDAWFYALCLAAANYYVLYWNSIRKLGSSVHGSLQRSTFILRRAERVKGSVPSVFATSAYPGGVIALGPAVAVLSVALGAVTADRRFVEGSTGVVAGVAWLIAAVVVVARRRVWDSRGNTPDRVFAVAMFAAGLWLAVGIGGRFMFDAAWARAITALLGAAGASTIAYWVLQTPGGASWADDEASENAITAAVIKEFRTLPTDALDKTDGRRQAATALLNPTGEDLDVGELRRRAESAWTQSPRLGRATERLLGVTSVLRFSDDERDGIAQARSDIEEETPQSIWEWRRLSPVARAQCSLPGPTDALSRAQRLAVWSSQIVSWGIVAICSGGFVYYCVADLNWQRTPERFLALTYCVGAVAFQQILIGWITVAQIAKWRTRRRITMEALLRIMPALFQGPAVAAIFVYPDLWPVWATIGIGSTGLVNYVLQRTVRESLSATYVGEESPHVLVDRDLTSRGFTTWWITAAAYGLLLITFDVLIVAVGSLDDRGFYAACLGAGANLYVIVYNSLHQRGREVRGQVLRAVVTLGCVPPVIPAAQPRREELAPEEIRVGGPVAPFPTFILNAALLFPLCVLVYFEAPSRVVVPLLAASALLACSTVFFAVSKRTRLRFPVGSDVLASVALSSLIWGVALAAMGASLENGSARTLMALSPLAGVLVGGIAALYLRMLGRASTVART